MDNGLLINLKNRASEEPSRSSKRNRTDVHVCGISSLRDRSYFFVVFERASRGQQLKR